MTVALVGDGGDESFGGYERYRAHALGGLSASPLAALRPAASRRCPPPAAAALDALPRPALPRRRSAAGARALRAARRGLPARAPARAVDRRGRTRCRTPQQMLAPASPLADLRLVDMRVVPARRPTAQDRHGVDGRSLELRAPFLDHRVVELGLALPVHWSSARRGKRALKEAFAADLPPEIARRRKKTGFGVPLDAGSAGRLREPPARLLARPRPRPLPAHRCSSGCSASTTERQADHGHRLWCLCMLELWQRHYVDGAPAPHAA